MRLPSICIKATYLFVKSGKIYPISVNIRPPKSYKLHFSLPYLLQLCSREIQHTIVLINLSTYYLK